MRIAANLVGWEPYLRSHRDTWESIGILESIAVKALKATWAAIGLLERIYWNTWIRNFGGAKAFRNSFKIR